MEAGRPQHPKRVLGERHLRLERCAKHAVGKIGATPVRVDEGAVGEIDRHRVHGEVSPGEVVLDAVTEHHRGLARALLIGLRPVRRDLIDLAVDRAPDRAEALTLGPYGLGDIGDECLDLGRTSVGGGVQIVLGSRPFDQVVAHHPTDEEEPIARIDETSSQRAGLLDDVVEARRERAHGSWWSRRAASTTSAPGPPLVDGSGRCRSPSSSALTAALQSRTAARS